MNCNLETEQISDVSLSWENQNIMPGADAARPVSQERSVNGSMALERQKEKRKEEQRVRWICQGPGTDGA